MTRNWLCFVGCILGAGSGLVAQLVIQVPAAQETSLKQRVTGFWQPFVGTDCDFRSNPANCAGNRSAGHCVTN